VDRRSLRLGEIKPGVPATGRDETEAVADGAGDGSEEADRPDRVRGDDLVATKGLQRRRTRNAVHADVSCGLKTADGVLGVRSEAAIEAAGLEAALMEQELEGRHVPAALADVHWTFSELRLAALAEGGARLPAGDPVNGEPVLRLEGADGPLRPGPRDAVDRMRVEAERTHRDLQRRHVGTAGVRCRRRGQ
jgi:hypothetical protein